MTWAQFNLFVNIKNLDNGIKMTINKYNISSNAKKNRLDGLFVGVLCPGNIWQHEY